MTTFQVPEEIDRFILHFDTPRHEINAYAFASALVGLAAYKDQIELSCIDAAAFIETVVPNTSMHTLVNLDPPYYGKGPELYTNFYKAADHANLAKTVASLQRRWIVTYDDTPEIRALYAHHAMYSSSLNYSAQVKRVGVELLVADPQVKLPDYLNAARVETAHETYLMSSKPVRKLQSTVCA